MGNLIPLYHALLLAVFIPLPSLFHFCRVSRQADMKVQAFLWGQREIQTMQSMHKLWPSATR